MRAVTIPRPHDGMPFEYYCPICGVDLAESNYETFDADYFCPVCATQQRPSRVPAPR
jgi:rubredoxin